MDSRRGSALLIFIVLLGAFLRLYGIAAQHPTADDVNTALSAVHYMEDGRLGPTMWNHPNLRNILVYVSLKLFGNGAWGVKAVSLVLGSLSILFLGLAAKRLFGSTSVACLAAFLLAIDPVHIDFSRQAVHEVYMACFSLAGIYCALMFRDEGRSSALVISGISFGLGLASKWYVAFPLLCTTLYLIFDTAQRDVTASPEKYTRAVLTVSSLVLLPFTVYLLTFIPWFGGGFSFAEWFRLQYVMLGETATHAGYTYYGMELDHKPYLWFLKPVGIADVSAAEGKVQVFVGISNPVVWLMTLPAICYVTYTGIRKRIHDHIFVSVLFWSSYIPLIFTRRPVWVHTAFAVLPFAFMASAYALLTVGKERRGKRWLLLIFLCIAVLVAFPLYLLATGQGFETAWLRPIVELYRPSHERGLTH